MALTTHIGNVKVMLVREILQPVPAEGMYVEPDMAVFEANADWLVPHFLDDSGNLALSIHALVVESQGQTIMVDTCIGNRPIEMIPEMGNLGNGFLDELAAAGYEPEDIDIVLCTHLHFDHVGWNTILVDGEWVPTFPNARYLFGRTEYEYWDSGAEGAAITFGDAVRPVLEAGLADLVDSDHAVTDEIHLGALTRAHPRPRQREDLLGGPRSGDHRRPGPPPGAVRRPRMGDDRRRRPAPGLSHPGLEFRDRYADSGILIFGTHFAGPSCGHLSNTDGRWVFTAAKK